MSSGVFKASCKILKSILDAKGQQPELWWLIPSIGLSLAGRFVLVSVGLGDRPLQAVFYATQTWWPMLALYRQWEWPRFARVPRCFCRCPAQAQRRLQRLAYSTSSPISCELRYFLFPGKSFSTLRGLGLLVLTLGLLLAERRATSRSRAQGCCRSGGHSVA